METQKVIKMVSTTHTMPADLHEQITQLSNKTGLGFSKIVTLILCESVFIEKTQHQQTAHYYEVDIQNLLSNVKL
jgi:hypothetical protein